MGARGGVGGSSSHEGVSTLQDGGTVRSPNPSQPECSEGDPRPGPARTARAAPTRCSAAAARPAAALCWRESFAAAAGNEESGSGWTRARKGGGSPWWAPASCHARGLGQDLSNACGYRDYDPWKTGSRPAQGSECAPSGGSRRVPEMGSPGRWREAGGALLGRGQTRRGGEKEMDSIRQPERDEGDRRKGRREGGREE